MPFPVMAVMTAVQAAGPLLKGAGRIFKKKGTAAARMAQAGVLRAGRAAMRGGGALARAYTGGGRAMREPGLRRKHRRGLSGADIRGAQRVARVVMSFGFKPKFKKRSKRRGF